MTTTQLLYETLGAECDQLRADLDAATAELDRHLAIVALAESPEFVEMLKANLFYQQMVMSKTANPLLAISLRRMRINVIESMLETLKGGAT